MNVEEYLDLVDENDNIIGREKRSVVHKNNLRNFRVINAFIINDEGKLWIPRRTADKANDPLALDMSVGGHVESGSTYEETLAKEAQEELNIDVNEIQFKEVGYFKAGEHGLKCFQKVYEIRQNDAPKFNKEDFIGYYWLSPQELVDWVAKGEPAKFDLPILIKELYLRSQV
jgi:isopentenyl-diphosphate delta-isomerase